MRSQVKDRRHFGHIWPQWRWPLTQWPQNQKGFSATKEGCLDQVWGGSMRSHVIGRKRKGYRWTDRPTCTTQYALSSSKGSITM